MGRRADGSVRGFSLEVWGMTKTTEMVLVRLLEEAVETLQSIDIQVNESRPHIKAARESVNELHDRLGHFDSALFPGDTRRRLEAIRTGLSFPDLGSLKSARRDLAAIAQEVRQRMAS